MHPRCTEIDVARIIANEIRLALENCKHSGGKAPAPLIFPSLITSLCLKAGVQFHTSQAVVNPGTIDDEYVERYCLPRSKKRTAEDTSAPNADVGGPNGVSFDDYDPRQREICNYNWDMMEAQQRAFTQMHASMANLQLQFRNPTQDYPIPTPADFSAFCAWPEGRRPFFSRGAAASGDVGGDAGTDVGADAGGDAMEG